MNTEKQCVYYKRGYCNKGLPDTECKGIVGCLVFTPKSEQTITISQLRNVLNLCVESGYINQYGAHRIIELIQK